MACTCTGRSPLFVLVGAPTCVPAHMHVHVHDVLHACMYCSTYQVELSPALSAGESLSSPLSTDNKHASAIMDLGEGGGGGYGRRGEGDRPSRFPTYDDSLAQMMIMVNNRKVYAYAYM